MYCSRECQKAAWPSHRYVERTRFRPVIPLTICLHTAHRDTCRATQGLKQVDAPQRYAGYESPVFLVNAIRDWVTKQHVGLRFLARATVVRACNLGEVFATSESSQVLVYHITPRPSPSVNADWNPGNAFRLDAAFLVDRDYARSGMGYAPSDERWEEWIATCATIAEEARRAIPDDSDEMPFLGIMPTLILIDIIKLSLLAFFPMHGTRYVTTPANDKCRPVFDHIVDMSTWCINQGCVMRINTKRPATGHFEPDVGVYERKENNKWKWQIMKTFDWHAFGHYEKVDERTGEVRSRTDKDPVVSWAMFYNL
ncbi:hypothetical protein ACG7TL_002461 [Trametes sanguinea]